MRKKLLIALAVVALLVLGFAGVVAMQPADFRVVRSATINAPPSAVFAQVNDFHCWEAWSPWAKMDPDAKNSFEGPASGQGAIFRWAGNADIGEGSMTIVESRPSESIKIKLEFLKPMEGVCDTEFSFQGEGQRTAMTWSMAGKNNFIAKAMCLFMSMDKMVGGQFEQGMENIKSIVESAPVAPQDDA